MKLAPKIISVFLVVLLAAAWLSFAKGVTTAGSDTAQYLRLAESSEESRLWLQAVEYYRMALQAEPSERICLNICADYASLYEEEPTADVFSRFMDFAEAATGAYPESVPLWEIRLALNKEAGTESKLYETAKTALGNGASSDKIVQVWQDLHRLTEESYTGYVSVRGGAYGQYIVSDGERVQVVSGTGAPLTARYKMIGQISDSGWAMYDNNVDARLQDGGQIPRARFSYAIEDAGCYDEVTGWIPVRIGGTWYYMNRDGGFQEGEYRKASGYSNGYAIAEAAEGWVMIDGAGTVTALPFRNVLFDARGFAIQPGGIVIAESGGQYQLYDSVLKQIGSFSADEIDSSADGSPLAFRQGELWGFVSTEGDVLVEPKYPKARSYSNGYAAVADKNGLWGFIDERGWLAVEYGFRDVMYFTDLRTCFVNREGDSWRLLSFRYE